MCRAILFQICEDGGCVERRGKYIQPPSYAGNLEKDEVSKKFKILHPVTIWLLHLSWNSTYQKNNRPEYFNCPLMNWLLNANNWKAADHDSLKIKLLTCLCASDNDLLKIWCPEIRVYCGQRHRRVAVVYFINLSTHSFY